MFLKQQQVVIRTIAYCLFLILFIGCHGKFVANALQQHSTYNRRDFVATSAAAGAVSIGAMSSPLSLWNANAVIPMPLSSTESRNVDVGGGYDLLQPTTNLPQGDVLYPPSMEGVWVCRRIPVSVEGDLFQAQEVWKALGGMGTLTNKGANQPETYLTRFLQSPDHAQDGVVQDRGYELLQRRKQPNSDTSQVIWAADQPNTLQYSIDSNNDRFVTLTVKSRTVELPSETTGGFGSNELVCIEEGRMNGGVVDAAAATSTLARSLVGNSNQILRAAQIKRRFRRSYDEAGNRVVEGLELIKTFRVLDGVAGTELPTSTIKSQLRLVRPPTSSS